MDACRAAVRSREEHAFARLRVCVCVRVPHRAVAHHPSPPPPRRDACGHRRRDLPRRDVERAAAEPRGAAHGELLRQVHDGRGAVVRADAYGSDAARRREVQYAGLPRPLPRADVRHAGRVGRPQAGGGGDGAVAWVDGGAGGLLAAGVLQVRPVRSLQGPVHESRRGGAVGPVHGPHLASGVRIGGARRRYCAVPVGDGEGKDSDGEARHVPAQVPRGHGENGGRREDDPVPLRLARPPVVASDPLHDGEVLLLRARRAELLRLRTHGTEDVVLPRHAARRHLRLGLHRRRRVRCRLPPRRYHGLAHGQTRQRRQGLPADRAGGGVREPAHQGAGDAHCDDRHADGAAVVDLRLVQDGLRPGHVGGATRDADPRAAGAGGHRRAVSEEGVYRVILPPRRRPPSRPVTAVASSDGGGPRCTTVRDVDAARATRARQSLGCAHRKPNLSLKSRRRHDAGVWC